jgi:hypothetical protein
VPALGMFDEYLGVPNTQQTNPDTVSGYTLDPNSIDVSSLQNLDLSNINLDNINIPTYNELNAALTGGSVAPSNINELINLYNQQVNLLSSAGTLENVDINDRPYWYNTQVSGALANPLGISGEEFRAASGLPDSFSIYDSGQGINQQTAQDAYALLAGAEDPMQALSQYYGIDLQRTSNPDANYNNASKYGSDATKMAEFQSIIEPVLQKVIPYIQLTQGLRYDDALEYAYKNDPMISTLYNQYGVDLFRQTDDGSTYFFDPISGSEARTVEVKDSSFRDVGLALSIAAFGMGMGSVLSAPASAGGFGLNPVIGKSIGAGLGSALSGGDANDILTSMVLAGGLEWLSNTDLAEQVMGQLENATGFDWEIGTKEFGVDTQRLEESLKALGDTLSNVDVMSLAQSASPELAQAAATVAEQGYNIFDVVSNVFGVLDNVVSGGEEGSGGITIGGVDVPATPMPTQEPTEPVVVEPTPTEPVQPQEETPPPEETEQPTIPDIWQDTTADIPADLGYEDILNDTVDITLPDILLNTDQDIPIDVDEETGDVLIGVPTPPQDGTGEGEGTGEGTGEGAGEGTGEGAGEGSGTGEGTGQGNDTNDQEDGVGINIPILDGGSGSSGGGGTGEGNAGYGNDEPEDTEVIIPLPSISDLIGEDSSEGGGGGGGESSGKKTRAPTPINPYMASISFNPQMLTPLMPKQPRDYLAELIARLQK